VLDYFAAGGDALWVEKKRIMEEAQARRQGEDVCEKCGKTIQGSDGMSVLDGYVTGGSGYVKRLMCRKCAAEWMKGKKGLWIDPPGS
jgi:hypothetical protein